MQMALDTQPTGQLQAPVTASTPKAESLEMYTDDQ